MATGNKNRRKKKNEEPDLLTIVVVMVAIILVIILLTNYLKDKKGGNAPANNTKVTVTQAPQQEKETSPVPGATQKPEKTATPTVAPTPTEAGGTPTPTEVPVISAKTAQEIIADKVDLERGTYTLELLDDHLMIDGSEYYSFCVNGENGESMEPLLIVEKTTGTLYCYDFSGVVSQFSKFPLDKTETGNTGETAVTAQDAKEILTDCSKERLGLAAEPSHYEMTVDDWTTVINGTECYGINLFEEIDGKQKFRGVYYVSTDGKHIYSMDGVTGEVKER